MDDDGAERTREPGINSHILATETDLPASKTPVTFNLLLAILACAFAGLSGGTVIGYTSAALVTLENSTKIDMVAGSDAESWFGSIATLGILSSSVCLTMIVDWIGRRWTLTIGSVISIISFVLTAASQSVVMICCGRFLSGVYAGFLAVSVPIYLSEIAPARIRGRIVTVLQFMNTTGALLMAALGIGVNWVWLAVVAAIIPCGLLVLTFFITETPHWYFERNRRQEGIKALHWLRGGNVDVTQESDIIIRSFTHAGKRTASFQELLKPSSMKPFSLCVILSLCQQWCGISAVMAFTTSIFTAAGTSMDPLVSSMIVNCVNVFGTTVPTLFVDKIGRRILILTSSTLMTLSLSALGAYYKVQADQGSDVSSSELGWLPLVSLMVMTFSYSLGWGSIMDFLVAEMMPTRTRGLTAGVIGALGGTSSFIVSVTFNSLVASIHEYNVFWMYAAICAFGFFAAFALVPETKGKQLEDIEEHFKNSTPIYIVYLYQNRRKK